MSSQDFFIDKQDDFSVLRIRKAYVGQPDAEKCVQLLTDAAIPGHLLFIDFTDVQDISVNALKTVAAAVYAQTDLRVAVIAPSFISELIQKEGLTQAFITLHMPEGEVPSAPVGPGLSREDLREAFEVFIRSCVESVVEVFRATVGIEVKMKEVRNLTDRPPAGNELGFVAEVISFPFSGTIALFFPKPLFEKFVAKAFGITPDAGQPLMESGGAELLNSVLASVRKTLNGNFGLKPTLPTTADPNLELGSPTLGVPAKCVVFTTGKEEFIMHAVVVQPVTE